jgi:hypothetical protein
LQIKDFFEYAGACKDYLNLCEKEQSAGAKDEHIKLSFQNNWKFLPPNYFCVFDMQGQNKMFSDVSQDFTISSGRTIYEDGGIGLEMTFAMFDKDCGKNQQNCAEYGYMSDSDFVHEEEVEIKDAFNLKIAFINIFKLRSYANENPDHFEVLVKSIEPPFAKIAGSNSFVFLIIGLCLLFGLCVGGLVYYIKKHLWSKDSMAGLVVVDPYSQDTIAQNAENEGAVLLQNSQRASSIVNDNDLSSKDL